MDYVNNSENKLINYFELNAKYLKIAEELKDSLNLFKSKIKVDIMTSITEKIYNFKKQIKNLILFSNSDTNRDPSNEFYIGFHYIYLFNTISKKINVTEIKMDLIDLVEENLEKEDKLLFEYNPFSKNFIFKSINSEFLLELKYEYDNLKDQNLSKIFPFYLVNEQLNKILYYVENDPREAFKLKLLVYDNYKNVKYLEFSFKLIINMELNVFLYAKYKNLDYIEGEIVSQNVFKPKNLLIIHETGWIISQSETFRFNILKNDRLIKNFFDMITINGVYFIDLFFRKKFSGKFVDINKLREPENAEKMIYKGKICENFLSNYFENELRDYFTKRKDSDNKYKKTVSIYSNSIPKQKKVEYKNSVNNFQNFKNENKDKNDIFIKKQTEKNTKKKKIEEKNIKSKSIEINILDLFKPDIITDEIENFQNFKKMKINLEDIFKFQDSIYLIFDFEKIANNNSTINNLKSFRKFKDAFIKPIKGNDNSDDRSVSILYSSQATSTILKNKNDEIGISKLVRNNLKSYLKIKEKNYFLKVVKSIYILNSIMILLGVIFIVVFSQLVKNFDDFFVQGFYNFKKLQVRYIIQVYNFASYLKKEDQRYNIKIQNKENPLDNNLLLSNYILIQNNILQKVDDEFFNFLQTFKSNSDLAYRFSKKFKYFDINPRNISYVIKTNTFSEILQFYYSNFLVLENALSKNYTIELTLKESVFKEEMEINSAIVLIFKNYFSVLNQEFKEIGSLFLSYLNDNIDILNYSVLFYNFYFLFSHLIILIILLIYFYISFKKLYYIFKFFQNIDNDHISYLTKKFEIMIQSARYLLSPNEIIRKVKNLRKKIMFKNSDKTKHVQNSDILNNQLNLLESKKQDNFFKKHSSFNKNSIAKLNEMYGVIKEKTCNNYVEKNLQISRISLEDMKKQIKQLLLLFFWKTFFVLFCLYFLYFSTAIFIFKYNFDNTKKLIEYTNLTFEDQVEFYNGFILFKLGLESDMNTNYALNSIKENESNLKLFSYSEIDKNKEIFLESYENIFKRLVETLNSKQKMQSNYKIF